MRSYRYVLSTVLRVSCALTLFWIVGCKSGGAPANATLIDGPSPAATTVAAQEAPAATTKIVAKKVAAPNASDTAKKANFKINVTSPPLKIGGKGAASVSIAALNGYKWNKEYPAKLLFKAPTKNVTLGKTEFKQMAGDFKIGDKAASIAVSMKASSAGTETVKGALKFSICNETACIIEKTDVELAINVQP